MTDEFGLPPVKSGLRDAAARLRDKVKPKTDRSGPPGENGVRLATIPRGDDEELRLAWAEYNGRHFLNLRIWKKDENGAWWPEKGKGLTVRIRELADFAEGVARAVDLASNEAVAHG